jgi:methylmalonyl-CoA mutase N-terminal domain/subunit
VVGVNRFTEGNDDTQMELLEITNEDEARQLKRLDTVRHDRNQAAVDAALARLASEAADPEINLMPALIDAASSYATLGEMMRTLAGVFGRHVEVPTI